MHGEQAKTSDRLFTVCMAGLMFVPNFEKALKEFHRVLKREGTLVLAVWGPIDQADGPSIFFNTFKGTFEAQKERG